MAQPLNILKYNEQNEMENVEKTQRELEAQAHYERGKQLWAEGKRGAAITEYNTAVELDPQSPAVTALEIIYQIMDFFDPNQLNP